MLSFCVQHSLSFAAQNNNIMDKVIKLEELAQLAMVVVALYYQPIEFRWWAWIIIFLLPDISMLGYLINTTAGAISYNFFHHKLVAIAILGIGWSMGVPSLTISGLVLYGHSSWDRALGYGLKYFDSFKHTSLSTI
jgi:hypothetical protein